ncbi:MAG: chemotaxis protein CheD, partial [bacterium]
MSTASKKTTQTVKLADMRVSGGDSVLVTHALGSCLGLMIYDPAEKVGGLLHAVLPLSTVNPERARTNPLMFVDLGVPRLFRAAYELGAERARLVVK